MCKSIICHCEWNEVERRIHPKGVDHRKTLRLLHFVCPNVLADTLR
ncbi:MAG: hypothetical protein AAGM40_27805 [Cyanobacteria bacterium J06573_2]